MQDSTKQEGEYIRGAIGKMIAAKKLVLVESIGGPYSILHFSDGTKTTVGYTNKELNKRYKINTKMVRRGFYAVENEVEEIKGKGVLFQNRVIEFSRRAVWLLLFVVSVASAQNVAPVAVNDTINHCQNLYGIPYVIITPTANDIDEAGNKLIINSFTQPHVGDLLAEGNKGRFRYYFTPDSTSFDYTVKQLTYLSENSNLSNIATVFINAPRADYTYSGVYATNAKRYTCRSTTSGVVTISGTTREVNQVVYYGLLLPGTTIEPEEGGVFELKAK